MGGSGCDVYTMRHGGGGGEGGEGSEKAALARLDACPVMTRLGVRAARLSESCSMPTCTRFTNPR